VVIAAPPFKRIVGDWEETGAFVRPVVEARGFTAMGRSTMTNRRKRWLRRFAIGVSLAAFAAPAAAKPTPAGGGGGVALQQSAIQRPDDRSARFTVGQQVVLASALASTAVRPDDRADRFAISDGASAATSSNSGVSWDGAVTLGLGTLVLVLALGIGISYIRRPRIAGL
jgi:hypothetical protein